MRARMLDVMGDVLDKPVIDRDGRLMGRADGVTVAITEGEPPRLEAVLIGPVALASRVSPRLERCVVALRRLLRLPARPAAVPFTKLDVKHLQLDADVTAAETDLLILEQRLQRWLANIPGSR